MAVDLSIVLPIYNEAARVEATLEELHAVLEPTGLHYEILCIDDGSTDESAALATRLAEHDPRIVPVQFTRNFGKEAALHAGVHHARGEAAIFMDADGQHPPALVPQLIELWRHEGYEVVETRKRRPVRNQLGYRVGARIFAVLIDRATGADMLGASDFKLLGRSALEALRQMPEHHRYFRGLVHWIGFESATVQFEVDEREHGGSRWSRLDLVRYAFDAILSFTTAPLVWIAMMGVATTGLGAVMGAIALYQHLSGTAVDGFTTVVGLLVIFSGLILTSLGTMALYLGRLFEEVKRRPLYVVKPRLKPDPPAAAAAARRSETDA